MDIMNYALENFIDYCDEMIIVEESSLAIATEGTIKDALGKIGAGLNNVLYKLRTWLQSFVQWVRSLFYRLNKTPYLTVNMEFYNQTTSTIDAIHKLGPGDAIKNQVEKCIRVNPGKAEPELYKLKELYQDLQGDYDTLTDYANKIPEPKENGIKTRVPTSKLNSMKTTFDNEIKEANELIKNIPAHINALNQQLQNTQPDKVNDQRLTHIGKVVYVSEMLSANFLIKRGEFCKKLIESLFKHGQVSIEQKE